MSTYKVTLRVDFHHSTYIQVKANNHAQAKSMAEHQTGLVVLSTEFVG